jgi:acetyl/propionyl-CoA carboxylase alpha subunit
MIGKLITVAQTREEAINTMYRALSEYVIEGVHTTIPFHLQLMQNEKFRKENSNITCIYCSPDLVSQNIPTEAILFILEMNNDSDKIIGIGMVRNHPILNRYFVYENGNYNRYVYTGKYRIDRTEMSEEEEKVMKIFDLLCFKGNRHMKRGHGLKSFPADMLYRCSKKMDLVKFIANMFKIRLVNKNT